MVLILGAALLALVEHGALLEDVFQVDLRKLGVGATPPIIHNLRLRGGFGFFLGTESGVFARTRVENGADNGGISTAR